MTKICHFLTALILTAAALATPSASAHLALSTDGIHWGFAVDATTQIAANNQARMECERKAGDPNNCSIHDFNSPSDNTCIALGFSNETIGLTPQANTTVAVSGLSTSDTPTRIDARNSLNSIFGHLPGLNLSGIHFTVIDLAFNRDVCDSTCSGNTIPPQFEDDVGGCEPVKSNSDCETVAARDMNDNVYVDTNTNGETICREELACSEGNRIPNGSGGCTICDANQMANDMNNDCIPLVPVEVEVEVPVEVEVTVTMNTETKVTVDNEITLTIHTTRTSENIITVTATDGEEFAITTTSGSAVTITASSGEIFVVNNQGSASGEPGGETPQSGGISTIEHKANNEKTAVIAAGIGLGVGAVALALYYFIDSPDKIIYEPSYAFQNNNGNLSYSLGNRWTATADNWRFYWQAKQNDKFVYGSGIGYNNGLLSAAINSQSEKDKTDLDVQLSANKTVGLWNLGGGVNFDMALSESETETQNRLNAKVRYKMDKWILSANANTDGKKAAARINYSYRF